MNMVHIVKTCFLRKVETPSSSGADSSLFLVNSHCCLFGPHLWLGIHSIPYWSHLHVFFSPSLDCKLFEGNNLIFFFFYILSETVGSCIVGSQLMFVEWQFISTTLVVRFEVSEFFMKAKSILMLASEDAGKQVSS